MHRFKSALLIGAIGALLVCTEEAAQAQDQTPADKPTSEAQPSERRFGATVGVASLPRPLSVEMFARINQRWTAGVAVSHLPSIRLQDRDDLWWWNVDAVAKLHPFKGPFFVGATAGFQTVTVENPAVFGERVAYTSRAMTVGLRAGATWVLKNGLTFGIDIGFIAPLLPSTTHDASDGFTTSSEARKLSKTFGTFPMPVVDLLRAGYAF